MFKDKLHNDPNFKFSAGVFYQRDFIKNDFEEIYLDVREKEGRLFSDEEVLRLPETGDSHPLKKEWSIRKLSSKKLFDHLNQTGSSKNVLEVGCGNGWLTHQLSMVDNSSIIGIDVNEVELKQAARVFNASLNVAFVLGDLFTVQLPVQFDAIILASSLQYFDNLEKVISVLFKKLSDHGAIHIIDSPFYSGQDIAEAQARSVKYFDSRKSKMHRHYHHHSREDLATFKHTVLYNPAGLMSRVKNIFEIGSPFPWIKIERTANEG